MAAKDQGDDSQEGSAKDIITRIRRPSTFYVPFPSTSTIWPRSNWSFSIRTQFRGLNELPINCTTLLDVHIPETPLEPLALSATSRLPRGQRILRYTNPFRHLTKTQLSSQKATGKE